MLLISENGPVNETEVGLACIMPCDLLLVHEYVVAITCWKYYGVVRGNQSFMSYQHIIRLVAVVSRQVVMLNYWSVITGCHWCECPCNDTNVMVGSRVMVN